MPKEKQAINIKEGKALLQIVTGLNWTINVERKKIWYVGENQKLVEEAVAAAKKQNILLTQQQDHQGRPLLYFPWDVFSLLLATKEAAVKKPKRDLMTLDKNGHLDLHGFSEEKAKEAVLNAVRIADPEQTSLRVVTGRGNHKNARGERGTLLQKLPEWLSGSEGEKKIRTIEKNVGYYDITFKDKNSTFDSNVEKLSTEIITNNFDQWNVLADNGDAHAQYMVGLYYKSGKKVKKNTQTAFKYFEKSANQNWVDSQFELGSLYWLGDGTKINDEKALFWLKKAADQGHEHAAFNLAKILFQHSRGAEDDRNAVMYFEKIQSHLIEAQRFLGHAYYHGKGVTQNLATAFHLYKRASDRGNLVSHYFVAECYREGSGIEINPQRAFEYYKKGSEGGDADAKYYLAIICYYEGFGTPKNLDKATSLMEELAEIGHPGAQYFLYERYTDTGNQGRAEYYLKKSAEAGFIVAQIDCAISCLMKQEVGQEEWNKWAKLILARPVSEFLKIELKVSFLAQFVLFLLSEENTKKQNQKCARLLEYCASQKDVLSCERLGDLYSGGDTGIKIPKNLEKAFYYWELGANEGSLRCLVALATCYEKGIGVKKDAQKAAHCLQQIENRADPKILFSLGRDCKAGLGIPPNFEKAQIYFSKAVHLLDQSYSSSKEETTLRCEILCEIARLYLKGDDSLSQDYNLGISYLMQAAKDEYTDAIFGLQSLTQLFFTKLGAVSTNNQSMKEIETVISNFNTIVDCIKSFGFSYPELLTPIYANACLGLTSAHMLLASCHKTPALQDQSLMIAYDWAKEASKLGHEGASEFIKELESYKSIFSDGYGDDDYTEDDQPDDLHREPIFMDYNQATNQQGELFYDQARNVEVENKGWMQMCIIS